MAANSSSVGTALKVIHYLHPSIIMLSYLAPLTYRKTTRRIDVRNGCSHRIRWTALSLMFLLVLSYTVEAIVFLYRSYQVELALSCIEVLTSGYIVGRRQSTKERKSNHADTGGSDRLRNNSATAV
jgi:hypothetical protein